MVKGDRRQPTKRQPDWSAAEGNLRWLHKVTDKPMLKDLHEDVHDLAKALGFDEGWLHGDVG